MAEENEKTYYFIKASVDFIMQNLEMKKLRRVNPAYVFIYFKLIAESLESQGHIYFKSTLEDYCDDFELLYHEDSESVKNTILECNKLDLVDIEEGHLYFNQVPDLTTKETESARKKRNQRAKKKAQEVAKAAAEHPKEETSDDDSEDSEAEGDSVETMGRQCPDNVSKCPPIYRSKEVKNKELIINNLDLKEEVKEEKITATSSNIMPFIDYTRVVDGFMKYWPGHRIRDITDERKLLIRSLLSVYSYEEIEAGFRKASRNPFLSGKVSDNGKPFHMNFNWIIKRNNFADVIEGRYDRGNATMDDVSSGTDYAALEEQLLEN